MYLVVEFQQSLHPDYATGQIIDATMPHVPAVTALGIPSTFTLMEVMQRLMVTYDYLMNKYVRPLQEKRRAEGRAEGRAEAVSEIRQQISEWNERRLAAAARNEPFDEPPPTLEADRLEADRQ